MTQEHLDMYENCSVAVKRALDDVHTLAQSEFGRLELDKLFG